MKKIIWQYWEEEGQKKNPLTSLCMQTVQRNIGSFEYNLVTPDNLRDYLPDIRSDINEFDRIAHKADYIRFNLLKKYGGFWLDADCVLFEEINKPFDLLKNSKYDFCAAGANGPGRPSIWFMGSYKNSDIVISHCDKLDKMVDKLIERKMMKNISWTLIGHELLWETTTRENYLHLDLNKICPITSTGYKTLLRNLDLGSYVQKDAYGFMLFNETYCRHEKNLLLLSEQEILNMNNLLSKVLRKGLHLAEEKNNAF